MPRTNLSDVFDPVERTRMKPKIIKRNTFQYVDPEGDHDTVIRLHRTDIVRKHSDGSVTLDSGGWRTPTTKDRMQDHLPGSARIWQERGQWYVSNGAMWNPKAPGVVPFFDGIRVPHCFTDNKQKAKAEREEAAQAKLRKQINRFVRKLDGLEQLPEPGPGDCWDCCLRDSNGKTMGDHGKGDHILSHVKEGYLHGSLIWNALEWAGYREPAFIWHHDNDSLARGGSAGFSKRALRRYLRAKLQLATGGPA